MMTMIYPLLKSIHVISVAISITGFILRFVWMLRGSPLLQLRLVKVLPHIIDTLLLASAIGLTITISQYPGGHGWLTAKVLGLLAYIVLGSIAIKRGKTRQVRLVAGIAALAVVGYIVLVAIAKDPLLGMGR